MERDRQFPPIEQHWSELKEIRKSPAHYRAAYLEPRHPNATMEFGTLTHNLVLGGACFVVYEGDRRGGAWTAFKAAHDPAAKVVLYDGDRRGKAWTMFRDAQSPDALILTAAEVAAAGLTPDAYTGPRKAGVMIVTSSELAEAQRVAAAVRADPVAAPLLDGARLKEQDLVWEVLGRKCGGRVDIIGPDYIAEFKTTNFAEPGWFGKTALRMGYHGQLAWYQDGARANGFAAEHAFIIAVETERPFAVTVMQVTPRALEEGRKLARLWLERAESCRAVDEWPGYVQCTVPLDIAEDAGLIIDGEEVAA